MARDTTKKMTEGNPLWFNSRIFYTYVSRIVFSTDV